MNHISAADIARLIEPRKPVTRPLWVHGSRLMRSYVTIPGGKCRLMEHAA